MRRIHTVFAALAPLVLAGSLLGVSARSTRADDGNDVTQDVSDDDNDDNDGNDAAQDAQRAAQADAVRAAHDAQRAARDAQRSAQQQARDAVHRARDEARQEIQRAREQVMHDGGIPPAIREMVLKRLDKAATIVDKHLDRASNANDLGALTAELSAMGSELGQEMGGMGDDMQSMQKDMAKMGRDMAKQYGKGWKLYFDGNGNGASATASVSDDDDDDHDVDVDVNVAPTPPTPPMPPMPPMPPTARGMHGDIDVDMSDLDVNVNLDDLQLSQPQRDQLQQILAQEQQASDQAEQQINGLSDGLRGLLQDPGASESDISRMVDQVNAAEGGYRKERILAWARARKVLSEQQRDALMRDTRHHGHHHAH